MQNHGGVYRTDDGGDHWLSVGAQLPSDFGFPIVGHPRDPERAYVLPINRWPRFAPDHALAVYRTRDGGQHWEPRKSGLPQEAFSSVLRDAFTSDAGEPLGLYFGTTSGAVYGSSDEGEHWRLLAEHLPRIYSVVAVAEE
ncbi:WD40/YVTN/BNR-like repeat-containing protein [Ferroacidibacillus organovorans]|uniref:Glycosyl hydrolase n=1 Tax=Ferroacidibacillus organovorans TaxID=1765683 RepID=A0A101XTT0_9BACL|nr:hypothetical protein [Ferroacidibacillus organovorans]KUO97316.1 hypothetical protein ATW55_04530 [Ferroacidibacillus organovorans]